MIAVKKETNKEIKKGDLIEAYYPPYFKQILIAQNRTLKTATFQYVSDCGKKIIVKERAFDTDWSLSYHPSSFNLEIKKS